MWFTTLGTLNLGASIRFHKLERERKMNLLTTMQLFHLR